MHDCDLKMVMPRAPTCIYMYMYMYIVLYNYIDLENEIINTRRACAARVIVVVLSFCLSVCLSVTTFSAATSNKTANKR